MKKIFLIFIATQIIVYTQKQSTINGQYVRLGTNNANSLSVYSNVLSGSANKAIDHNMKNFITLTGSDQLQLQF